MSNDPKVTSPTTPNHQPNHYGGLTMSSYAEALKREALTEAEAVRKQCIDRGLVFNRSTSQRIRLQANPKRRSVVECVVLQLTANYVDTLAAKLFPVGVQS